MHVCENILHIYNSIAACEKAMQIQDIHIPKKQKEFYRLGEPCGRYISQQ